MMVEAWTQRSLKIALMKMRSRSLFWQRDKEKSSFYLWMLIKRFDKFNILEF